MTNSMGRSHVLGLLWVISVAVAGAPMAVSADPEVVEAPVAVAVVGADSTSHDQHDHHPVMRCRMCGAKIADAADYLELREPAKAVSSRPATVLGHDTHVHTFVNPSRVEMELVAFRKAIGLEGEAFTNKATFFEGYNWRDLRCGSCNRHIGWKFHHDELQECIHTKIMESVSAKAQEELKAANAEEQAKKRELVRKELEGKCVTASAGWWAYQVCYGKEVRQFHEEPDGTRPSDWSMGVYAGDNEAGADAPAPMGPQIVQYFTGGQHCDENGELRNSKVVYQCCKSDPKEPTVENVEEPSLCSYVITVCVPSLCDKKTKSDSPYDYDEIAQTCEADFDKKIKGSSTALPASFAALRWSTVIAEDSSELDWARDMQFKA